MLHKTEEGLSTPLVVKPIYGSANIEIETLV